MKRLIFINIGVFLTILLLLNIGCYYLYEWGKANHKKKNPISEKLAALPNYIGFEDYQNFRAEASQITQVYYPHELWRNRPQTGKWVNIDSSGFRKTIHNKSSKTAECWFLGGSVAWGLDNPDHSTIPSLFALTTDTFQVMNYAELGFTVRQNMIRLTELLAAGKTPNIVISLDGFNEMKLCLKDVPLDGHPQANAIKARLEEIENSNTITDHSKAILDKVFISNTRKIVQGIRKEYFGRSPSLNPAKKQEYCCYKDKKEAEQIAEHLLLNWEMMHEIVRLRGGQFIAILQPHAIVSKARTDHISNKIFKVQIEELGALYPIIQRKIQERQHEWIYDFTSVFDNHSEEYIYTDVCHVSPIGNHIITDTLVKKLFYEKDNQ